MAIKLHRTHPFREGAQQGQTLCLDDDCLTRLSWLDQFLCDKNHGRSQPDSPFNEIHDWYWDGQFWSDSYNTRWNVAVTLYYLATHPDADEFGWLLVNALNYRDDWSNWTIEKRQALADTVFLLWQRLLDQPSAETEEGRKSLGWARSFAGRFFELAKTIDHLDSRFLRELFQPGCCANRFFYACLFVTEYWERIRDPNDPWRNDLPTQMEIRTHLQWGFFEFQQHEDIASLAEQYIAWNTHNAE